MRITADVAEILIADFTTWINKQVGEDLYVLEHVEKFTCERLGQPMHIPHPRVKGAVIDMSVKIGGPGSRVGTKY